MKKSVLPIVRGKVGSSATQRKKCSGADVGRGQNVSAESKGAWLPHGLPLGHRHLDWALLCFGECSAVCACPLTSTSDDLC